jgi:hypothetical protein
MRKTLIAIALVALVSLVAGPAIAGGKGGGRGGGGKPPKPVTGGGGTISPAWVGDAHYNQVVRFNVSTTATAEPWVNLKCYQGGTLVAQGWEGYFERSLDDGDFGLNSPMWTGGDADCTAYLTTPQKAVLASTSFHVYA